MVVAMVLMVSPFGRALCHNNNKVVEGEDSCLHEQLTGEVNLYLKYQNFSIAELKGAKSNFITQDTSRYQKLDNTKGSEGSSTSKETETFSYQKQSRGGVL